MGHPNAECTGYRYDRGMTGCSRLNFCAGMSGLDCSPEMNCNNIMVHSVVQECVEWTVVRELTVELKWIVARIWTVVLDCAVVLEITATIQLSNNDFVQKHSSCLLGFRTAGLRWSSPTLHHPTEPCTTEPCLCQFSAFISLAHPYNADTLFLKGEFNFKK